MMGTGVLEPLWTLLFPPRCPACGCYVEARGGWCPACLRAALRVRRLVLTPAQRGALTSGWTLGVYEGALRDLVRYYTREAGVRSLEREISKICRKVVKTLLSSRGDSLSLLPKI